MRDLRPQLHAMPPRNWMNDPNGLVWHDGWYHLFFQHNPFQPTWGSIHWGHLRSRDLLSWEDLPYALVPDAAAGEAHCFSGNLIIVDGKPELFYTSIGPTHDAHALAEQWLAHGSPDLISWQRDQRNPILSTADNGKLAVLEWRDPFIWQEKDTFRMVLGGTLDNQGCVLIYESDDLLNWSSPQVLYQTSRFCGCECPNYIALKQAAGEGVDDFRLLLYSPYDNVHAVLGRQTADGRFEVIREQNLDEGGSAAFYAANTFLAPDGRRLMFGWISDTARGDLSDPDTGAFDWNGLQSFPREIELVDGRLLIRPARELAGLRQQPGTPRPAMPEGADASRFDRCAECQISWQVGPAWEFFLHDPSASPSFNLVLVNDAQEHVTLKYDACTGRLELDRQASSLADAVDKSPRSLVLDQPLQTLQVFCDNSVLEVFANDQVCLTARVYPLVSAYDRIHWSARADDGGISDDGRNDRADRVTTLVWNLGLPTGGKSDVAID